MNSSGHSQAAQGDLQKPLSDASDGLDKSYPALPDRECVALLQWALPRLGLRWKGFKNVRRQVCRRVAARIAELGLDARTYRERLEADPTEQRALDALCYVTISRFYRDRAIFDALRDVLMPELAQLAQSRRDRSLRVWSAGCASGEEPYGVAILWHLELAARFPEVKIEIIATDYNDVVLTRASKAAYEPSSLRELPVKWRDVAFENQGDLLVLREPFRKGVSFLREDVRTYLPAAPLHLVLCRNVAFTYFDERAQIEFLDRIAEPLVRGGLLVVGAHESVPAHARFEPMTGLPHVLRRV